MGGVGDVGMDRERPDVGKAGGVGWDEWEGLPEVGGAGTDR